MALADKKNMMHIYKLNDIMLLCPLTDSSDLNVIAPH